MSDANKDVKLSLTVMINKQKNKVLFAEADDDFVDILLSFLTLPLGRIIKALDNHYGDEAVTIGSLSSLYHSLSNLDNSHFLTEGAKQTLLNPISSFEAEYECLKLDFTDSPPAEYFYCSSCRRNIFRSVSIYYDEPINCQLCQGGYLMMNKRVAEKRCGSGSGGVFTIHKASFIISDDLLILPKETGFFQVISILGIADMDEAEQIKVDFGLSEIMKLLKASLTSPTPLSDVILSETRKMNYAVKESQPRIARDDINPNNFRIPRLKVMIQKSTGRFLYAQAMEDFVEFLFSLLYIPLGGVEHLLAGKTRVKAIDNLYRSTSDFIGDKYFKKSQDTKKRLVNPNLPHGCISSNHILPLTQECLPKAYTDNVTWHSSVKFPKCLGSYLEGPQTYDVKDDLTVAPFCFASILSSLSEKKVLISDVEELELKIGLEEGLSIVKASLTSTSALTDALLTQISIKQPKREEV